MRLSGFLEKLHAEPFRPFVVELDSGRRVKILHPEDVVVREALIIVFSGGELAAMFETVAISAILPFRRNKAS